MRIEAVSDPAAAPDLVAVFVAAVRATLGRGYSEEQVAAWEAGLGVDRLEATIRDTVTVAARDHDGTVTGFANLVDRGDRRGELDLLYVHPLAAGRGVGAALVEEVERLAGAAGLTSLVVDASLLAAPMLGHLGYEVERAHDKVVRGVAFPNTWMRKQLVPPPAPDRRTGVSRPGR